MSSFCGRKAVEGRTVLSVVDGQNTLLWMGSTLSAEHRFVESRIPLYGHPFKNGMSQRWESNGLHKLEEMEAIWKVSHRIFGVTGYYVCDIHGIAMLNCNELFKVK